MCVVAELRAIDASSSHQFEEEIGEASSENGLFIARMVFSIRTAHPTICNLLILVNCFAHLLGARSVSLVLPKYSIYSSYVALGMQRCSAKDERRVSRRISGGRHAQSIVVCYH